MRVSFSGRRFFSHGDKSKANRKHAEEEHVSLGPQTVASLFLVPVGGEPKTSLAGSVALSARIWYVV
jgi:hypothetical protein